jgi:hypothetical protein
MSRTAVPRKSILVGILQLARGRPDGLAYFGSGTQTFLSSLAPLIAFAFVGAALGAFTEGPQRALTDLMMTLCALLTPAVVSHELARIWKRADEWLRFATAFNWCQWILPVLACLIMVPLSAAISLGLTEDVVSPLLLGCLGVYGLWLHWFLARNALALSRFRAVVLVFLVNLGTAAVVLGPRLLVHDAG